MTSVIKAETKNTQLMIFHESKFIVNSIKETTVEALRKILVWKKG